MFTWRNQLKIYLAALGYQVQGTRYCPHQLLEPSFLRGLEFDDIVCRRMFECGPELTFIQIGAFDGITRDPLRKYIDKCGWKGILVEPQTSAVDGLRRLYADNDRIVIVKAALDKGCGSRTLFTVDSEAAPAWAGAMASFQRQTIIKHSVLIPEIETMVREETVDCITFDDVLALLPVERVDLLQIDAEGFDSYLLSLFPFDRVRPAIVHWEVKHCTKKEKEDCLDRLSKFEYRFAPSGGEDMMAVRF